MMIHDRVCQLSQHIHLTSVLRDKDMPAVMLCIPAPGAVEKGRRCTAGLQGRQRLFQYRLCEHGQSGQATASNGRMPSTNGAVFWLQFLVRKWHGMLLVSCICCQQEEEQGFLEAENASLSVAHTCEYAESSFGEMHYVIGVSSSDPLLQDTSCNGLIRFLCLELLLVTEECWLWQAEHGWFSLGLKEVG